MRKNDIVEMRKAYEGHKEAMGQKVRLTEVGIRMLTDANRKIAEASLIDGPTEHILSDMRTILTESIELMAIIFDEYKDVINKLDRGMRLMMEATEEKNGSVKR